MTQPTLRPATPADIPAIAAIYRPAVLQGTASFELEPPSEAEMLRRFEAITGAGYPYFVAELDGRVAGYAYANAYRTRPGLSLHGGEFRLHRARRAGQRRRPGAARPR